MQVLSFSRLVLAEKRSIRTRPKVVINLKQPLTKRIRREQGLLYETLASRINELLLLLNGSVRPSYIQDGSDATYFLLHKWKSVLPAASLKQRVHNAKVYRGNLAH